MATRNENFEKTQIQPDAFFQLKKFMKSAVQLSFPDRNGMLSITADASNLAIGACLNQSVGDEVKPLSFFSWKLTEHEKRLSVFERELLAVFAAVRKWRNIFHGMVTTVFTDHKPIVGAFHNTKPRLSDKQQRQFSFIAEYVSDIVHISGKDNVVADSLSRNISVITSKTPDKAPCDLIGIAKEQEKSEEFPGEYKGNTICNSGPQLFCNTSYPNPRPVVPISLRKDAFDVLRGFSYPTIRATQRLINFRYFWVEWTTIIKPGAGNA